MNKGEFMKKKSQYLWMVLGVLLVVACGNVDNADETGGDTDTNTELDAGAGDTLTIEQFVDQYKDYVCEKFIECRDVPFADMLADASECLTYFDEQGYFDEIDQLVEKTQAGLVEFDGVKAFTCVEQLTQVSCALRYAPWPEICEEVNAGTIVDGQPCEISGECESKWCDRREDCPGICSKRVAANEACTDGVVCEYGAMCNMEKCVTYEALLGEGDDCSEELNWCDSGLYCEPISGKCAPEKGEGDPCTEEDVCSTGMFCPVEPGETEGTCVVYTLVDETDGVCEYMEGSICNPVKGLYCHLSMQTLEGVCQDPKQDGDVCIDQSSSMYYSCDDSTFCDMATQQCTLKKAVDEACTEDDECDSSDCTESICAPENGNRCS
jgi:hypothetical protein